MCKLGKIPSTTVLSTFHIKLPIAMGFVGVDHSLRSIVLVFGAVRGWKVAITGWDIYQRHWPPDLPGSLVYEGFVIAYETMKYEAIRQTEAAMSKYPGYQLLIIGHSQAATYTTFAAYDFARIHPEWKITAAPSGSPRVGNAVFAEAVNKLKNLTLYRLVYRRDGYTHMPPDESYVHVNSELFANDNDQLIKCNAMEPYGEDPRCSAQYSCEELKRDDHYEYFNQLF
ncbi:alpha/beta-hydrolase [Ramicandelaber brevisporus]|nr:alpha/beta-hydrolase [Ramicandelaber brevisporus]